MMILYGALGAVSVMTLFALGVFAGWKLHARFARRTAPDPEEKELRRIKAEQDAFRQLQNYNADIAYGIKPASGDEDGGDEL